MTHAPTTPAETDAERTRRAWIVGGGMGLVLCALFAYPSRAYPLQSLALTAGLAVVGVLLAANAIRRGPSGAAALGLAALGAFAIWSFWRWRGLVVEIPGDPPLSVGVTSPGRAAAITALLMPIAALGGFGIPALGANDAARAWRAFRFALAAFAIVFAVHGFWQYFAGYDRALLQLQLEAPGAAGPTDLETQSVLHALREGRVGGRLGNPNVFAALLAVLGAMGLSICGESRTRRGRFFGAAAYVLAAVAILLTQSRGGALTLALATGWAMALLIGRGELRAPKFAATAISFCAITFAVRGAGADGLLVRLGKITTIHERLTYWSIALKIWSRNWMSGASPGSFGLYYPQFKPPTARESRFAHSWFFHFGAETGVVGLALFLIFVIAIAWAYARIRKSGRAEAEGTEAKQRSREAGWLALGCGVLLFNGLFEYSLQMREFLLLFALMGGGLLGLSPSASASERRAPRLLACAAAMFCAVAAFASAAWLLPREQIAAFWEGEAMIMAEAGEHARAADYFSRAAAWTPDDESYAANQARAILAAGGDRAAAREMLARAESLNPLSPRIQSYQAEFLESEGDIPAALSRMSRAVELHPNDAGYRIERAEMLMRAGNPEIARRDLEYIEREKLPVWEYLQPRLTSLRESSGLAAEIP